MNCPHCESSNTHQTKRTTKGTVVKIDIKEFIVGTFLKIKKCLFITRQRP